MSHPPIGVTVCWSDQPWTVQGCWQDGDEDVLILQNDDGHTEDVLANAVRWEVFKPKTRRAQPGAMSDGR